jgi:hypothetical protein
MMGKAALGLAAGFDPSIVWARGVLDQVHSECERETAPPGAAYKEVLRYRRMMRT